MTAKRIALFALPVLAIGILGASMASAHGLNWGTPLTPDQIAARQLAQFTNEANMLGISADAVKQGWAEGKSFQQIAADNGISADQLKQKMLDARTAQLKASLQALVDKGVITQAQSDQRLAAIQAMWAKAPSKPSLGKGFGHSGFRKHKN